MLARLLNPLSWLIQSMISFERGPSRRPPLIYSRHKKIYHRLIRRQISTVVCNKKCRELVEFSSRHVSSRLATFHRVCRLPRSFRDVLSFAWFYSLCFRVYRNLLIVVLWCIDVNMRIVVRMIGYLSVSIKL